MSSLVSSMETRYGEIHRRMLNKYNNSFKIEREKKNAKDLQNFFIFMKKIGLNYDISDISEIDRIAFQNLYSQLEDSIGKINSKIIFKNYFLNSSWSGFESQIARLHQAAELSLTKSFSKFDKVKVGKSTANVGTSDSIVFENNIIDYINESIDEGTSEMLGSDFIKYGIIKKGKSGKIDVRGNKTIEISYTTGIENKILGLLANSNFSLKNYGDLVWDYKNKKYAITKDKDIKIGSTKFIKAIPSMIYSLGYSQDVAFRIANLGLIAAYANGNNSKSIRMHFNHLQFAYELSGAGLRYDGDENWGENDYFIYNNPDTLDIEVISVSAWIADVLKEENPNYSNIVSYHKEISDLSKLTKKSKEKLRV